MTDDEKTSLALNLSWEWFKYHADQRLKAFNFFVVVVGTLSVAFVQAANLRLRGIAIAVGAFGAIMSVGFWVLDVRNEELVNCGRAAIDALEDEIGLTVRRDDRTRNQLRRALGDRPIARHIYPWIERNPRRKFLFTHRRWLRSLEWMAGLSFFGAALWAAIWFR